MTIALKDKVRKLLRGRTAVSQVVIPHYSDSPLN